ncbi:MAG: helix-turn-helix transcriptional regulator [Ktedonobacteraceae bacterium]|nr:helix-turn-helix transcriptional regulator [Ktedonobacteraceae bacterium]
MYRLRVKELAEARGFDQSKLQRKANIAFRTITKIWHNPELDVQLSTLDKIAQALGVNLTDLIDDLPSSTHQQDQ